MFCHYHLFEKMFRVEKVGMLCKSCGNIHKESGRKVWWTILSQQLTKLRLQDLFYRNSFSKTHKRWFLKEWNNSSSMNRVYITMNTNNDGHKPRQWWPQDIQWWPNCCGHHFSWPSLSWFVAFNFCGRHCHGLWPSIFVATVVVAVTVMVCGHRSCGRHCHGLWLSIFVAIVVVAITLMVCGRQFLWPS